MFKKNRHQHHYFEPHYGNTESKLNWLRAGVLGANDGIVSIAGLVLGVAGATNSLTTILTAGIAGIIAGAISMAAGEYVSVSSSKDTEESLLQLEKHEIEENPDKEFEELVAMYQEKGLSRKTAELVAEELTQSDAYAAHVDVELGIDPNNLVNPWQAAVASAVAFLLGAMVPLFAVIIPSSEIRVPFTFGSVVLALMLTGTISAKIGNAPVLHAVIRVVLGGIVAMIVTYSIGYFLGIKGL
jgi:vacuolar iron transporter family protein